MGFETLRELVDAIAYDERRMEVKFGCDCGCGGDSFTLEQWKRMCEESDAAREKLEAFGVTFSEEY